MFFLPIFTPLHLLLGLLRRRHRRLPRRGLRGVGRRLGGRGREASEGERSHRKSWKVKDTEDEEGINWYEKFTYDFRAILIANCLPWAFGSLPIEQNKTNMCHDFVDRLQRIYECW